MRPIDADALWSEFDLGPEREDYFVSLRSVRELIEAAPTLDVAPKKVGKTVHFVPCVCGFNKHRRWCVAGADGGWFYECGRCGLRSRDYLGKTKIEAKEGWNRMIEELKAGELHD